MIRCLADAVKRCLPATLSIELNRLPDAEVLPVNRDQHGPGSRHQPDLKSGIGNGPDRDGWNDQDGA